jgi:hypothetical protein
LTPCGEIQQKQVQQQWEALVAPQRAFPRHRQRSTGIPRKNKHVGKENTK